MIRTQVYRLTGISRSRRAALAKLFVHLVALRYQTVFLCRDRWKRERVYTSEYELYRYLTRARREISGWDTWAVFTQRGVLKAVSDGYKRCTKGLSKAPKLYKRVRTFRGQSPIKPTGGRDGYYKIHVQGVGTLYFKDPRGIIGRFEVKSWRIKMHSLGSGFDIQLIYDAGPVPAEKDTRDPIGIDWGLKAVATLSNGTQYAPEPVDDAKLRRLSRSLSRAKKGSKSRQKKKVKRAKAYQRRAVRARNFAHRVTTDIVKNHSATVFYEDLQVKNLMAKGGAYKRGLTRSFQEKGLGRFKQLIVQKCFQANGQATPIHAAYTTTDCSHCGARRSDLTLRDRVYHCASCGFTHGRDVNAALNALASGLRHHGWDDSHGAGKGGLRSDAAAKSLDGVSVCTAQNHV